MPVISKIKNFFCCASDKYLLDDDDDDVSIFEHSYEEQQEVSEKPLLSDFNSKIDSPAYNQVIVKSVLRKKRNASISSAKSHASRRRYNVLLFGDNLTAGKIFNLSEKLFNLRGWGRKGRGVGKLIYFSMVNIFLGVIRSVKLECFIYDV